MKKLPLYFFVFLLGIAFAQAIYYYPMMPDPMASHFAGSGEADNFATKTGFFLLHAGIMLFTVGIFLLMPWMFQKFRVKRMNLPNREYWLTPERIALVYRYFRESFAWFGVVQLIFLIGVIQLVFEANLNPPPILNNQIFLILIIGYFVFVIIWLIAFYRKFKKVN